MVDRKMSNVVNGNEPPPLSIFRLLGMTSYMFATGLLVSTYGMITLALEAGRLAPMHEAILLPALLSLAGISQLVCPLAGYLSDRHRSRFGKRRPFIFCGSLILTAGLAVQWASRRGDFPGLEFEITGDSGKRMLATFVYACAFLVSMVALNFAYTAATCLVPDKVPRSQTGLANGVATLWQVAGSCCGFLFYLVVDDLDSLYALYLGVVLGFAALTLLSSAGPDLSPASHDYGGLDEDPFLEGPSTKADSKKRRRSISWSEIRGCYSISSTDPATRDFYYVWVSRTLYYTGGSAQAFLQFYIRDRLHPHTHHLAAGTSGSAQTAVALWLGRVGLARGQPARATCFLALMGYVSGSAAALPAGALSDVVGRKPVVVIACALMSVGLMGLGFSSSPTAILACGLIGGLGNGAYQAVDLALAVDTLPDPEQAAQFMGIWGVGAFVGVCLGPLIGGPLLYFFGTLSRSALKEARRMFVRSESARTATPPHNSELGYLALFTYGSICLFLSAVVLLKYVRNSR